MSQIEMDNKHKILAFGSDRIRDIRNAMGEFITVCEDFSDTLQTPIWKSPQDGWVPR